MEKDFKHLGTSSKSFDELIAINNLSPKQSASVLFNFMDKLEWLIEIIENKKISARYCDEDIQYLKLDNLKKVAIPMKCFCDINFHKLDSHLKCYGSYGIGLSKEWGIKNKIQPVQYIVKSSEMANMYKSAFEEAKEKKGTSLLKDYLPMQLMYMKPIVGEFKNRTDENDTVKYFTDECEWRFIPDLTNLKLPQIIVDQSAIEAKKYNKYNDAMKNNDFASLNFEYKDIKYIVVDKSEDFDKLIESVMDLQVENRIKYQLISKIIIWEESWRDF
ncbi:hypothetical protein H5999_05175 [[Clostridium] spiroforme]|nr:hypothetical protein [Thomasclavelia spiroformis]